MLDLRLNNFLHSAPRQSHSFLNLRRLFRVMDKIIILDMGGQYAHLLARRVRQLGVYSEILPSDTPVSILKKAKGIIISGGPDSVYEKGSPQCDPRLFTLKIPILGLCYGHQIMAHYKGGKVLPGKTKEYGLASLDVRKKAGLFAGLSAQETIWMSHGDSVANAPPGFSVTGSTSDCPIAAMADSSRNYYGVQFHPEVTHTRHGMKILSNFVVNICKARKSWSMKNFIENKVKEIQKEVGNRNVLLLISGGVDSTVCFALLNKALGTKRVYGLHIDNGFVRTDESKNVEKAFRKLGWNNFHAVDSSKDFLNAVKGVADPEKKRKIIGETFIRVQQQEVAKLKLDTKKWMLGQGTIYPDTIETKGTRHADLIKTHHNRVDLVQDMIKKGLVTEPIKELYKDEVRELGERLGLPKHLVWRHPFPGPGLAVRCLCVGRPELLENEDDIDRRAGLICAKYGATAKVMPVKSVGVQGDARTYRHPLIVSKINDYRQLEKMSTELTNKIKEINRVILSVGAKGSLNNASVLQNSFLTKERLDLLRKADDVVNSHLDRKMYTRIWQFPVVLAPLSFSGGESIILRPVESKEAMTANWAHLPEDVLKSISKELLAIKGIDAVFYDVTNKPPGTIEWE